MPGHYRAPRRRRLNRHRPWCGIGALEVAPGATDIPDSGGRQYSQQRKDVGRRRPKTLLLRQNRQCLRGGAAGSRIASNSWVMELARTAVQTADSP